MANRLNYWWSLPVISGLTGIFVALQLFPEQQTVKPKPQSLSATPPLASTQSLKPVQPAKAQQLVVNTVVIPSTPKLEPVQYRASIVNNRVGLAPAQTTTQSIKPANSTPASFEQLAAKSDISPELASRFTQALADMEADEAKTKQSITLHPQALTRYPQWYQDLVPALEFSSHIYSSDKDECWVKVNQQVVKEGELINADLRLVQITPEQVIIEMQQRQFTLPALSSW